MTSLLVLAAAIAEEHAASILSANAAVLHAKRAGELLIEAKEQLQHGEWLPWLASECPAITPRTASNYMRIAREWPRIEDIANRKTVSYLPGVREALDVLAEGDPEDRDDKDDPNDDADLDDEDSGDDEEEDDDSDDKDRRTFKLMRLFFDAKDFAVIQRQLRDLKTVFPRTADIFRAALDELHDTHFPDRTNADPIDDRPLDARF